MPTRPAELERLTRWNTRLRALLLVLTSLVGLFWLTTAAVHAADSYGDDRTSGSWLVLAERAAQGTLYPPLYDGHTYAGTRWMPLPLLAFAAAARLGGHGYLPAKLTVYVVGLALVAVLFACLRRYGTPRDIAAGLVALLLVTTVGFDAITTVAGDALALVFALCALLVVSSREENLRPKVAGLAAILSTLAVLSKSSAIWVVAAIAIFLFVRHRTLAVLYAATTAALATVGLALTDVASNGRFLTTLHELSIAGYGGVTHLLVDTPVRFLSLAQQFDGAVWLVSPLAVGAVLVRASRRRPTVFDVALPVVVVVTIGVLADAGTYANHLLEASAVVLVLIGSLWDGDADEASSALLDLVVPAALIIALVAAFATTVKPLAADTVRDLRAEGSLRYGPQLAADAVRPGETLLAEDPGIPYELAQRPVAADSFMLPRIEKHDPAAVGVLIGRIRDHRFDKIILDVPITDTSHFADGDFGPTIAAEIRREYRLAGIVGGRYVYVPR